MSNTTIGSTGCSNVRVFIAVGHDTGAFKDIFVGCRYVEVGYVLGLLLVMFKRSI
jgi:hypothetical protein